MSTTPASSPRMARNDARLVGGVSNRHRRHVLEVPLILDVEDDQSGIWTGHGHDHNSRRKQQQLVSLCLHESWQASRRTCTTDTSPIVIHFQNNGGDDITLAPAHGGNDDHDTRTVVCDPVYLAKSQLSYNNGLYRRRQTRNKSQGQSRGPIRFLAWVLAMFSILVGRWIYEQSLIAALPSCILPSAYYNLTDLAVQYADAIIPLFDPLGLPSPEADTLGDVLELPYHVPTDFVQPDDVVVDFAAELATLCQCVPLTGIHSHLVSLCEEHIDTFGTVPDRSIYTASQHIRLMTDSAPALEILGYLSTLSKDMARLETALQDGYRPYSYDEDDMPIIVVPDAADVALLTSLHIRNQVHQWLKRLHGSSGWSLPALKDADLSQLEDLVQALDARQGYIIDWASRHVPTVGDILHRGTGSWISQYVYGVSLLHS